jgi:SAM-dependent methyltransferase
MNTKGCVLTSSGDIKANPVNRMDLMARSYDQYAPFIVPRYNEIQSHILKQIAASTQNPRLVVDLGAGSGILLQRICSTFPEARVVWVDRSPAMRKVAEERLRPWQDRVDYIEDGLEEAWEEKLAITPNAIVSMSAIHHLDDEQKETLYQKCFTILNRGGCLWNGDEVKAPTYEGYRQAMEEWDTHMTGLIAEQRVDEVMAGIWAAWRERNLGHRADKRAGDDCHATVASQLAMLQRAGFSDAKEVWASGIWSIFGGTRM